MREGEGDAGGSVTSGACRIRGPWRRIWGTPGKGRGPDRGRSWSCAALEASPGLWGPRQAWPDPAPVASTLGPVASREPG